MKTFQIHDKIVLIRSKQYNQYNTISRKPEKKNILFENEKLIVK